MQKTKSFDGLMRIPLLRQVFADPNIRVVYRAIDNNWKYNQVFRRSVSGFNPYLRTVFLAKNSVIATWIKNGKRQDRIYNENDRLVGEVLFMMHDYLHCWAITVIQQAMPSLKLGWGKITEKNFEKYVFCHLLTEAVATVGLDYWFLSTINLSTYCDLGTNMDILTVSFHESKLREYQKFNQNLNVQSPNFFKFITKFYCDGQMHGFSKSDINKSPQLSSWLEHELTYGEQQRKYSRMWISHLSGKKITVPKDKLGKQVYVNKKWQFDLIDQIGSRLWRKIKLGENQFIEKKFINSKKWKTKQPSKSNTCDFRFTNINALNNKHLLTKEDPNYEMDSFDYFFQQLVCNYEFKSFPQKLLWVIDSLKERKDIASLLLLFKKLKIKKLNGSSEPLDIFFLN